jgi:HEAT repeat protein
VPRLKELAFSDRDTPNESWLNTIGYLAELNPRVRMLFVEKYPFWMINSSPGAFSTAEKTQLVRAIFKTLADEDHYIYRHPRINLLRLGRFLTSEVEPELVAELASPRQLVRGNALVLLGLRPHPDIVRIALDIVRDRTLDLNFGQCAVLALRKAGGPALVPELAAFLDHSDPLQEEILDSLGSLCDESQIPRLLPLLLAAGGILSASFYHFREFRSREAVLAMLDYFRANPHDLNVIRAESYLEPLVNLLSKYWDEATVEACVRIIEVIDEQKIYPDRIGIAYKLFDGCSIGEVSSPIQPT